MSSSIELNVTLADGREVASDSIEWRDECLVRHQHVAHLRTRTLPERRAYLAELERTVGTELALRVADDYLKDRERRKARREWAASGE